jgi:hypothetical protein
MSSSSPRQGCGHQSTIWSSAQQFACRLGHRGRFIRSSGVLLDAGATRFDWFADDARAGQQGKFDELKCVSQERRDKIMALQQVG